ncbi:hypothetical protein TURU_164805 [Turdus rufiventris]|nr:hypothetical protein TURU_164805 [Turdus rufiventris]
MPSKGNLTGWRTSGRSTRPSTRSCTWVGNPKHKYRPGRKWIESSPEKKDLGNVVDKKLNDCRLLQQEGSEQSLDIFNAALSGSFEKFAATSIGVLQTLPGTSQ